MGDVRKRWCGWMMPGMIVAMVGCGGGTPAHPDTGYGADQPAPTTISCAAFCLRSSDCLVDLCDEDKSSTEYVGLEDPLTAACQSTCVDAQLQSGITQSAWACLFQQSCREVFQDDACRVQAHYSCT